MGEGLSAGREGCVCEVIISVRGWILVASIGILSYLCAIKHKITNTEMVKGSRRGVFQRRGTQSSRTIPPRFNIGS